MSPQDVIDVLSHAGRLELIEPSPRTGHIRYYLQGNDVYWAIEKMGGNANASLTLGASSEEIETWIDTYFVPFPYAEKVSAATGYSLLSLQQAPTYVSSGQGYWPHTPSDVEVFDRLGMALIGVHPLALKPTSSK